MRRDADSAAPVAGTDGRAARGPVRVATQDMGQGSRTLAIWSYRSLIWNFTRRDLKSRYKGTAVGWGWSFLVPLATVVIYSVVFSVFIRIPPPSFGNGEQGIYAVWLIVGMVTWAFISNSVTIGMPTLVGNGPLMQKVYIPSFVPVTAAVLTVSIQSLIEIGIVLAILAVLGNVAWTWLLLPIWAVLLSGTALAVSYTLAVFNVHWRDLAQITGVVMQLLFFLSPVIYPLTIVPETVGGLPVQRLMEANPLTQFIEVARELLYDLSVPSAAQWGYLALWAGLTILVARWVFGRWGQDIGESV